jgi:hypothetical protein
LRRPDFFRALSVDTRISNSKGGRFVISGGLSDSGRKV